MCSTTRTVPCRAAPRRAAPRRAAPRRAAPRTRTLCLASRPRIVDAHPASVRPSHGLQNPATRAGEVCGFLGFVERLLLLGCFSVVCASIYFASEMVEALQEKIERNNTAQIVRFVWRMQRNSAQVLDRFEQRVHGGFEGGWARRCRRSVRSRRRHQRRRTSTSKRAASRVT